MEWQVDSAGDVALHVTRQELRMLNNALSESLDRVPDRIFPTVMGGDKGEVEALLADLRDLRSHVVP